MKEIYQLYLAEMARVWSPASLRSESSRLNNLIHLIDGDAEKLWDAMKDLGRYSRTTYWTRVSAFWDWAIDGGHVTGVNPYKRFKKKNPQCFRGAYTKKPCQKSVKELRAAIAQIPDQYEDIRNKLAQLLAGGLRRSESYTLTKDGYVLGKGGKARRAYLPAIDGPMAGPSRYSTMLMVCHKYLGVTPHKLRSAKITAVARDPRIKSKDLQEFAGWASIATAESYVAANHDAIAAVAMAD